MTNIIEKLKKKNQQNQTQGTLLACVIQLKCWEIFFVSG